MGVGCSVVAVLMYAVSKRLKLEGSSLHTVTLLNLGEQIIYNLLYPVIGVLYFYCDFDANGALQALVFYLGHLVGLWVMHAQVVAFFFVCAVDDPFRSDEHYAELLVVPEAAIEAGEKSYMDDSRTTSTSTGSTPTDSHSLGSAPDSHSLGNSPIQIGRL